MSSQIQKRLYELLGKDVRGIHLYESPDIAVLMSLMSLSLPPFGSRSLVRGDSIIVPANLSPRCINSILFCGLIPVPVDVHPRTFIPNSDEVESLVEEGTTKAVFMMDSLGNPIDSESIRDICDDFNLLFLEYNAGGVYGFHPHGAGLGTLSDVYITSARGYGIVTTRSSMISDCLNIMSTNSDYGTDYRYAGLGTTLHFPQEAQKDVLEDIDMCVLDGLCVDNMHIELSTWVSSKCSNLFRVQEVTREAKPGWNGLALVIKQPTQFTRENLISYCYECDIKVYPMFGNYQDDAKYGIDYDKEKFLNSSYLHENGVVFDVGGDINKIIKTLEDFIGKYE